MKNMLTVREVAQKLGCTLKYVYDLLYCGRLPANKLGRRWMIPLSAVESHLKERNK